jgi:ATP-dependent Lon protease
LSATNDDDSELPEVDDDIVTTGAAADSGDWDERLKGLPRLMRYAALVFNKADHVEHRLVAEIDELCPQLQLNAAWARGFDTNIGVALAYELDHRAVVGNEPDLRSLADCVRFLSLPTPHEAEYFEEHRRAGKALIQAFRHVPRDLDGDLLSSLEGFVFGWAALPICGDLVTKSARAKVNAQILATLMVRYRIGSAEEAIRSEYEAREEELSKGESETATRQTNEPGQVGAGVDRDHYLVVAKLSDAEMKNPKVREIVAPFRSIVNVPLPLVQSPSLQRVRNALLFEFPYAADIIDFALTDLIGHATVHVRPLLIVGGAGAGKSRFARRLGEELGVSVWRTDASQCDGAAFAGTSRRWHSSEPCHPFLAVAQGKIANPLILIDEIEKAATRTDYGRLWDCLLAFLERETSARYPDPSLQVNLDLSQVGYVATANRLDPLPSPIRERFRVVMFPRPSSKDLGALLPTIIHDLTKERGLEKTWETPLDEIEYAAVARRWRGGSVRRLRRIVEAVFNARDLRAVRH